MYKDFSLTLYKTMCINTFLKINFGKIKRKNLNNKLMI